MIDPTLITYAQMRVREDLANAELRSRFPRPPRATSRVRRMTARLLLRLAARLSDEVVTAAHRSRDQHRRAGPFGVFPAPQPKA